MPHTVNFNTFSVNCPNICVNLENNNNNNKETADLHSSLAAPRARHAMTRGGVNFVHTRALGWWGIP